MDQFDAVGGDGASLGLSFGFSLGQTLLLCLGFLGLSGCLCCLLFYLDTLDPRAGVLGFVPLAVCFQLLVGSLPFSLIIIIKVQATSTRLSTARN